MDPIIKIQELAPPFMLPDLDGMIHYLEQYRGRIVVLNFWSAECPWVQRADEQLLDFLTGLEGKVVLLPVATNANEGQDELRRIAQERRLPQVLHDSNQQVARLYGAQATPHFYVIDERGHLRYQGAFDDVTFRQRQPTRHYVVEAITALLVGKDPAITQSNPYGCALVWET